MSKVSMGKYVLGVYRLWLRIRNRLFSNLISSAFASFGKGSTIQLPTSLWGEAGILIGKRVHIGPSSWLLNLSDEVQCEKPIIEIQDGCSLAGNITITAIVSVCIEKEVLCGRNVHISDHAHAFSSLNEAILHQGVSAGRPVRICEGAWLGQGVVVCPGVTIGRNSVIGANSIVRSDIPSGAVAAGVPAKVIRMIDP